MAPHSSTLATSCEELLLLLLLLSHIGRVRLCVTPEMAAQQAPPFLGFSWQEHWGGLSHPWDSPGKNTSGLSLPSPMHKSESEVTQLCLTLSDPMDCSLPGSSAHGIWFRLAYLKYAKSAYIRLQFGKIIEHKA